MGAHEIIEHYRFIEHPCSAEDIILCLKKWEGKRTITPPVCPHSGDVQEIQTAPGRLFFLCPDKTLIVCVHLLLRTMNNIP